MYPYSRHACLSAQISPAARPRAAAAHIRPSRTGRTPTARPTRYSLRAPSAAPSSTARSACSTPIRCAVWPRANPFSSGKRIDSSALLRFRVPVYSKFSVLRTSRLRSPVAFRKIDHPRQRMVVDVRRVEHLKLRVRVGGEHKIANRLAVLADQRRQKFRFVGIGIGRVVIAQEHVHRMAVAALRTPSSSSRHRKSCRPASPCGSTGFGKYHHCTSPNCR